MNKYSTFFIFCLMAIALPGQSQEHRQTAHDHIHHQRDLSEYASYVASQTNEDYFDQHDHELWHFYLNRVHPGVNAIETYFEEAAEEFGVPVDLLKAIGQVETNWTQIGPSIDRGWGIMHLVQNHYANTLSEAAELIGTTETILKDDARQNIRAAAALLAKYAGPEVMNNNDLSAWFEAAKTFSALANDKLRTMQAETYFKKVKSGNSSNTVWNETIEIQPRPDLIIPQTDIHNNTQHRSLSADYPPAYSDLTVCNFGTGRNTAIDTWVNHWIGVGSYAGAISWFHTCRPEAPSSAHFVIRSSDGEITQVVAVANTAYHAGASGYNNNGRSIGIEHEATATNPDLWNSTPMLNASTTMACYFFDIYNIPPTRSLPGIREHNEMPGTSTQCAGNIPWATWMDLFTTCAGTAPTLDCSNAVTITCDITYSGPASTAPSNVGTYACNTWTETGPERVHKVTSPGSGTLTAQLSNYTGDLDVYILGSCDPNDCIGTVNSDNASFASAIPGQVYYIVVDADDGSGSAYDLLVTCPTGGPTAGLDCSNAVALTCGVTYSGPASTAPSNVGTYACNTWTEAGPERVHTVVAATNGAITAQLSNYTGDLDVYILGSCDPDDCIGTVTADKAMITTAIAGQTYYVVVDADDGSGSAYDLLVTCAGAGLACDDAIPLTCGVPYSGASSTAVSQVDTYACNTWSETGPERVHSIVSPANGTLSVQLSNYIDDLDVYILASCDPTDCVGTVGADNATFANAIVGQTYYLVVDADDGSSGVYDIVVTCPVPTLDCSNAVALACGVPYSGAASTAISLVDTYACNTWTETGPERVHSIVSPADGTLSVQLSNFTGDLDVYILASCDPADCVGTVGPDSATLANAVAGQTYYLVVDADDGSGSAYDIVVTCPVPTLDCSNAVALTCGVPYSGGVSVAASVAETYSCSVWVEPGPERIHTIVAPADGPLTATISNFAGDLDIFILASCDATDCLDFGDDTATVAAAVTGQTYYVIVDAYDGTGGSYDLLVSCPEPSACVDAVVADAAISADTVISAIQTINSAAIISTGTVVDIHAGTSVQLNAGFTVEQGAEVNIYIEECQ